MIALSAVNPLGTKCCMKARYVVIMHQFVHYVYTSGVHQLYKVGAGI